MAIRALLVEDNSDNRLLLRFTLSKHGWEVIEVATGEEAVALATSERPDLIIMDLQLPDIDGLEATRRIRDTLGAAAPPIVAVSSYAMGQDRAEAEAAGCDGYIEKPINTETIVAELETYL